MNKHRQWLLENLPRMIDEDRQRLEDVIALPSMPGELREILERVAGSINENVSNLKRAMRPEQLSEPQSISHWGMIAVG